MRIKAIIVFFAYFLVSYLWAQPVNKKSEIPMQHNSGKITSKSQSSNGKESEFDLGLRLIFTNNQALMGNLVKANSIGIGGNIGLPIMRNKIVQLPVYVFVGLNYDYITFERSRKTTWDDEIHYFISNAYGWAPYVRISFGDSDINPFLYGTAGCRFFRGRHKYTVYRDDLSKTIGNNFTSDESFFTGFGGGIKFNFIELRVCYISGKSANMLRTNSVVLKDDGNLASFNTVSTLTDMIMLSIGANFH